MPVRRIPKSYTSLTGFHGREPGSRRIGFESSLERDFVTLMLFDPDFEKIEEQPVRIFYQDADSGRRRHYTPDFLVHRKSTPTLLVEVKPESELERLFAELKPKFDAAHRYTAREGYAFEVWTEQDIRTDRLKNARFLLPFRDKKANPGFCEVIEKYVSQSGPSSATKIITACWNVEEDRARGLSTLWHLLACGRIAANLDAEIHMDTPLTRKEGSHV